MSRQWGGGGGVESSVVGRVVSGWVESSVDG